MTRAWSWLLGSALIACAGGPPGAGAGVDGAAAGDGPGADAAPARPLRIAVVSDLNGSYGSTRYEASVHEAVAELIARAPDLVLSTGDMVAGQQAGLDYRAMWTAFHAAVTEPLAAAGIPLAVTPGNHDGSGYSAFAGERAVFVDEWQARRPALPLVVDEYPSRYAFTLGPALFVSLDATRVGRFSADERAWVEAALAAADRPVTIAFGHVPLHPFSQGREDEVLGDPALEAALVAGGVDLFVSGHHHVYYPGQHDALRVLSMPCLGAGPRRLVGDAAVAPRAFVLLEVDDDGVRSVEAFAESDWSTPVARAGLPARLSHAGVVIDRDDLVVPAGR